MATIPATPPPQIQRQLATRTHGKRTVPGAHLAGHCRRSISLAHQRQAAHRGDRRCAHGAPVAEAGRDVS